MALNLLVRYQILQDVPGLSNIDAGNFIAVYWDDDAQNTVVRKFDDASLSTYITLMAGFALGVKDIGYRAVTPINPIQYSFCNGSDLISFTDIPTYPYVKRVTTPNHFSCVSAVCDLSFSDEYTTNNASDNVTADGSFSVIATSSNGPIQYSLYQNFSYTNGEGQTTGVFTGILAGTYVVTAKDALGCIDQITITVGVPEFYNTLYRLEYTDVLTGVPTRLDIEERGYIGEIIEVKGTDDPIVLRLTGDGILDPFTPVIPSELIISLIAETNFQFRHLFSQDERKYKAKYYKDYGRHTEPFITGLLPPLEDLENDVSGGTPWVISSSPTVHLSSTTLTTTSYLVAYDQLEADHEYKINYSINYSGVGSIVAKMSLAIVDADNFGFLRYQSLVDLYPGLNSGTFSFNLYAPVDAALLLFVEQTGNGEGDYTLTQYQYEGEEGEEIPGMPIGFELKFVGYVISSNYSEAYVAPPYPVTIVATDGLADLQTYDFIDANGKRFGDDITSIKAISEILRKTDLNVNIQSAINKYEVTMSKEVFNDPLAQKKFNPKIGYSSTKPDSCYKILETILSPLGARIIQRNGKWFIYCIEESVKDMTYREYDYIGTYITNGSVNDTRDIKSPIYTNGAAFAYRDQVLESRPTYGVFYFEHKLIPNPSLVDSYSFEDTDLYEGEDGIKLFKNWNINIANSPGATFGIKETKSFEGKYNFFYKPYNVTNNPVIYPVSAITVGVQRISLLSKETLIEFDRNDSIEFSFNYAILIKVNSRGFAFPDWVRIKWMIRSGNHYLNASVGAWVTDPTYKYNDVYVDKYNEAGDFKILVGLRDVDTVTTESLQIELILESEKSIDFIGTESNFSQLKAIPTESLNAGIKTKGLVQFTAFGSDSYTYLYYELVYDDKSQNLPLIVRPNDYNSSTNIKVWKLTSADNSVYYGHSAAEKQVDNVYIDNVVLKHYPNSEELPKNITLEVPNNKNIRVDFEKEYLLGDIDTVNINNSERNYLNYFKKLDGSPTVSWERKWRTGTGNLLELLADEITSQYKSESNKLTGSIVTDVEILPSSVLREVNDNNRKYMFMGYEYHDKMNTIVFDLSQIKDVVTDDTNEDITADFSTDFSLDFFS